jgi:hypothetical protein
MTAVPITEANQPGANVFIIEVFGGMEDEFITMLPIGFAEYVLTNKTKRVTSDVLSRRSLF